MGRRKAMNEEKPMTTEQQKALEALQALHAENERLGLYKDAYAQSMTTQTQVLRTEEELSVYDTLKMALKAMKSFQEGTGGLYEGEFDEEIKTCEEALSTKCVAQPAVAEQHKQKRPQNCGTSYCSCIECVMEPDYKALWEQMCERCDELDKKLAQLEQVWTPERIAGIARLKEAQAKKLAQPEQELDYKAIGQQVYESGYSTGYMDCAVKMKAQPKQEPIAKVCHDIEQHIGWNPNVNVAELPEGMELYGSSQPKESEKKPVTWIDDYNACKCPDNEARCFSDKVFRMMQKHITPPRREWVGLTVPEIEKLFNSVDSEDKGRFAIVRGFTKAIEAKLKEKNTNNGGCV